MIASENCRFAFYSPAVVIITVAIIVATAIISASHDFSFRLSTL